MYLERRRTTAICKKHGDLRDSPATCARTRRLHRCPRLPAALHEPATPRPAPPSRGGAQPRENTAPSVIFFLILFYLFAGWRKSTRQSTGEKHTANCRQLRYRRQPALLCCVVEKTHGKFFAVYFPKKHTAKSFADERCAVWPLPCCSARQSLCRVPQSLCRVVLPHGKFQISGSV